MIGERHGGGVSPTFSPVSAKFVLKLVGILVRRDLAFFGMGGVLRIVSDECGFLGIGFESGTRVILQPSLLNA